MDKTLDGAASDTNSKETFEKNLKELEMIVKALENGNTSLDEMLAMFEKGVRLTRECTAALDKAEQRINVLIKNSETGEMTAQPFKGAAEQ
ncbi:MAG TPA: exodeoxyribonuclease VII small subunit [Candidatus Monoglobus merdigallinarum]|uniref:Exodeoxyribonuclease 7 small subunit n=1 Tax=Candidatus Monoglobus merdigallinarum TaxID=2838698 RepID=A0A9D1PPQ2_9FIRM|nr:exodeoxyribonuclease VII small subunit [Candidatus Monoglobus merdigallinarum]